MAEKYHRPPEEVENWDPYWLNRAILKHQGENMHDEREENRRERQRRARR